MNDYLDIEATMAKLLAESKSIAVVGLSSRENRAGYYVPAYLQDNGYKIIPVNPNLESALGEKAYPDLTSIPVPIDLDLPIREIAM